MVIYKELGEANGLMNIAICDDDTAFLNDFEKFLLAKGGQIHKYTSVSELINSKTVFDIAFLDIQIKDETIFEAVKYIYSLNRSCVVAFLTNYSRYMKQGYSFGVFRYILKTEPQQLIIKQINEVYNEFYARNKAISGTYKRITFNLFIRDIIYIEVCGHVLYIFTDKGVYNILATISDIMEKLDCTDFVQCHRSFIVNLNHVHSIKGSKELLLSDAGFAPVPIGKKYLKEVRKAYNDKFGEMCISLYE